MILGELGALAEARRSDDEPSLAAARGKQAAQAGKGTESQDEVATGLEAFRAMLPVELLAPYSTVALLLQTFSQQYGADARAATEAELAKTFANRPEALKHALAALTVETADYLEFRIGLAVLATLLIAFVAGYQAQVRGAKKWIVLEPVVLTITFIAFALGAPGTVLPVFLNASDLFAWTATVVLGWGMVLAALTLTFLKKKSWTRISTKKV